MDTTRLMLVVGAVLVLTVVLRFALQPGVRQIHPRTRYRLFAVLLGIGAGSQALGAVVSAASGKTGDEVLFFATGFLLSAACVLEMRKLRREF